MYIIFYDMTKGYASKAGGIRFKRSQAQQFKTRELAQKELDFRDDAILGAVILGENQYDPCEVDYPESLMV